MKAIVINEYGSTDVLQYKEDVPMPEIGPNDILVRNKATSVNPVDTLKRDGYGWPIFEKKRPIKFPWILGNDTSGIVEQVGTNVTKFKIGDEVFGAPGIHRQGTWAEYTAIAEDEVTFKPKNLSFEEAGSIPFVALTSWAALVNHAKLTPVNAAGKRVLVHAGSGGVGSFAIQLLKAWDCYVATTCSTRNVDLLKTLGADEVIDYTKEDFSHVLKDFDVVFDAVGIKVEGNEEKAISILRKNAGAVYVSIVHPMVPIITKNGLLLGLVKVAIALFVKKIKNRGISYQWSVFKPNADALEQVRQYIEAGKIKPVIDRVLTLDQMTEAHNYIATGHARGKVVITI